MSTRSTIRIRRELAYRDALRSYAVKVDGVRVGRIRPGQTLDFDVEPGEHSVRLTISWTGSPEVATRCAPGGCVMLTARPRSPFTGMRDIFTKTGWIELESDLA